MIGKTLSHYKVIEKIGQGGMGEIQSVEKGNSYSPVISLRRSREMVPRTYVLGLAVVVMFIAAQAVADPLHDAAEKSNIEEVIRLIAQGADVNAKDDRGPTALILASENGHVEVVSLLLSHGADVNAQSDSGTALVNASRGGHATIVRDLGERGANLNLTDKVGLTALHLEFGNRVVTSRIRQFNVVRSHNQSVN